MDRQISILQSQNLTRESTVSYEMSGTHTFNDSDSSYKVITTDDAINICSVFC